MSSKLSFFNEDWLDSKIYPEFAKCLVKAEDRTHARCRVCQKSFELSNMGVQALRSHQRGKKHALKSASIACFFTKSADSNDATSEGASKSTLQPTSKGDQQGATSSKQQTLKLCLQSAGKVYFEIMWALNCCLHGISGNSNRDTKNYFKPCFQIAKLLNL